jgi:hypothetical protein
MIDLENVFFGDPSSYKENCKKKKKKSHIIGGKNTNSFTIR